MRVRAKVLSFDDDSYDKDSVIEAVHKFNLKHDGGTALGEILFGGNTIVSEDTKRFSHVVDKLIVEDDGVYALMTLLDTEYGKHVERLINQAQEGKGTKVFSVGMSMVVDSTQSEKNYIKKVLNANFHMSDSHNENVEDDG